MVRDRRALRRSRPGRSSSGIKEAKKAALYEVWRQAGISQRRLARDLDVAESEVRHMLIPNRGTKAATIDRALRRLGKRVTVTAGEAA